MIDFLDAFNRNFETYRNYTYAVLAALLLLHAGCVAYEAIIEWHRKPTKRAEAMDAAFQTWLTRPAPSRTSQRGRRTGPSTPRKAR